MLIDGGSTSKKNVGKYQIIPVLKYKGIGRLDAVVLTHEDEDHISGIFEVLDDMEKGGIRVEQLVLPEVADSSKGDNYRLLERRANELGIPVAYINTGETFMLGGASFTCLNPERDMITEGANAYSTVLYMKYGQFTALFTGDMEEEGLDNVKRKLREAQFGRITLLKVAHHGSQYTTDEEFLTLTNPRVALISCGRDNAYGHPHEELLERIDAIGAKVYRTDLGGLISATFDGSDVRLSEFLQE
jgi:competence protein ComEC